MTSQGLSPNQFRFDQLVNPLFRGSPFDRYPLPTFPENQGIQPLTPAQLSEAAPASPRNQLDTPPSGMPAEMLQANPNVPLTSPTANIARDLYQPEMASTERLNKLLDEFPIRGEPGIANKIFAGVASLSGNPAMVEHALYPGYERELGDWKERLGPVIQSAALERANNATERQVAAMIASQEGAGLSRDALQQYRDTLLEQAQQRINDANDRAAEQVRLGEQRLEETIAENKRQGAETTRRLDIAERNAKTSEGRLEVSRALLNGGSIGRSNITGKAVILTRDGRQIPAPNFDNLDFESQQQIEQDFAIERQNNAAEQARQTQRERPQELIVPHPQDPARRARLRITTDANGVEKIDYVRDPQGNVAFIEAAPSRPAASATAKPLTESAVRLRRVNQAKIARLDPRWRAYVRVKGLEWDVTPAGMLGPSEATRNEIIRFIMKGTEDYPVTQGAAGTSPTTGTPAAGGAPSDTVQVINPQGVPGYIPRSFLEQALKQGYKEVK